MTHQAQRAAVRPAKRRVRLKVAIASQAMPGPTTRYHATTVVVEPRTLPVDATYETCVALPCLWRCRMPIWLLLSLVQREPRGVADIVRTCRCKAITHTRPIVASSSTCTVEGASPPTPQPPQPLSTPVLTLHASSAVKYTGAVHGRETTTGETTPRTAVQPHGTCRTQAQPGGTRAGTRRRRYTRAHIAVGHARSVRCVPRLPHPLHTACALQEMRPPYGQLSTYPETK